MIKLRLSADLALANAAAFFVMATGAVNWALPFGTFLWACLTLTVVANLFLVPAILLKHRGAGLISQNETLGIIGAGCVVYALARSLLGMTAAAWAPGTLVSHTILVPAAVALVYFATLALALLAAEHVKIPALKIAVSKIAALTVAVLKIAALKIAALKIPALRK